MGRNGENAGGRQTPECFQGSRIKSDEGEMVVCMFIDLPDASIRGNRRISIPTRPGQVNDTNDLRTRLKEA